MSVFYPERAYDVSLDPERASDVIVLTCREQDFSFLGLGFGGWGLKFAVWVKGEG